MKIECLHGYFLFEETRAGQISDFMSLFGLEITKVGNRFTFQDLADAPRFSIEGSTYLGAPAVATFEGEPWEVMRANNLVYDFTQGVVVPISSITQAARLNAAGNYFVSTGMILPGSITEDGSRVTDYAAFYVSDRVNFKYSEVTYV
jgi:hypothetical protein